MTKQEKTTTAPTQPDTVLVPLSKLKPSPANVRRTEPDRSIAQLAASIRAHGLLQPLLVEPDRDAEGRETGCWRVVAGERRRKALRRLVKERALPRTARVACRCLGQMDGAEASLAENVERESMHPLDEADAFAALVAGGSTVAEAAHRFGVSETLVRQRLRLAALEPSLAALFRQGALGLAQAQALTLACPAASSSAGFRRVSTA